MDFVAMVIFDLMLMHATGQESEGRYFVTQFFSNLCKVFSTIFQYSRDSVLVLIAGVAEIM